jgi:hypothetical protein
MNEAMIDHLRGYLLLPPSRVEPYRGVDRKPFLPSLLEGEMDENAKPMAPHIGTFYPPGWRRETYRLYEEHLVAGQDDFDPFLLADIQVARQIQHLIDPHAGAHEIVACEIWGLDPRTDEEVRPEPGFLGHDVAYLGGDFYSAVLNGLYVNPAHELVSRYKPLLNECGLFPNRTPLAAYVHDFKKAAPSEADSEFYIWRLVSVR